MIWVWILIGFVVGEGSMAGVWYWMEKKRKRQKEVQDKGRVVIPLRMWYSWLISIRRWMSVI